MTGCEACGALARADDSACATCGADLPQASSRKAPRSAAPGKVVIPVRRYGHAPAVPRAWRSEAALRATRRRRMLLVLVLVSTGFIGALLAALMYG